MHLLNQIELPDIAEEEAEIEYTSTPLKRNTLNVGFSQIKDSIEEASNESDQDLSDIDFDTKNTGN